MMRGSVGGPVPGKSIPTDLLVVLCLLPLGQGAYTEFSLSVSIAYILLQQTNLLIESITIFFVVLLLNSTNTGRCVPSSRFPKRAILLTSLGSHSVSRAFTNKLITKSYDPPFFWSPLNLLYFLALYCFAFFFFYFFFSLFSCLFQCFCTSLISLDKCCFMVVFVISA